MTDARNILLGRMKADLIGPGSQDEEISDRPTDRYLTGILFPPRTDISPEHDDEASDADDADESGTAQDGIKIGSGFRPSSAGLSFAIRSIGPRPLLQVCIHAARYRCINTEEERHKKRWKREPRIARIILDITDIQEKDRSCEKLDDHGLRDITLHYRIIPWGNDVFLITLALTNNSKPKEERSRIADEEATLFQVSFSVECTQECQFVPKPGRIGNAVSDDDGQSSMLLYRDVSQWVVGHTCSAIWEDPVNDTVRLIRTEWFPEATVYSVSAEGDHEFRQKTAKIPLAADWLASCGRDDLCTGLASFVDAYGAWISKMENHALTLPEQYTDQANKHMYRCRKAEQRMRNSIALLERSPDVMTAFRLANSALALQYSWRNNPHSPELVWRPFQLGFALLCLESIADPQCPDRETMDLLWFPTGGGKTEAYLLLTAFTIFLRRLRAQGKPMGAGVTTFMRYTLRLLTIQQFERAAALICACELIRLGRSQLHTIRIPDHFSSTDDPISLGLWVGEGATPNTVAAAAHALETESENSPAQIQSCPCCHGDLEWSISRDRSRVEVRCLSAECAIGQGLELLPIWTVDEEVYREQPTLVIGTVDKYAQIARNQTSGRLFGIGTPAAPPDLVIQDELHLISGPLGSLAGLYETAIDEMCRSPCGCPAKVIGSTATIRRAEAQIRALFDRESFQFPPPGLDYRNSGFAIEDRSVPGRQYVGVTTIGRSAKFTQQAVAASLLQGAADPALDDSSRDGYWTLINYFNSLRELGGSLVLMRDDVTRSIREYTRRRHDEIERDASTQIELTSRVRSSDIPRYLKNLERNWKDPEHIDIVLASNMISVGMDVSRLGLMIVNGQPKTIAEYIQATSRVGRSQKTPGLIITLFNATKSRDRSRYETFVSWHASLYRDVEATSVTPFAARARDRALHAPYVAMVRHLVDGMDKPGVIEDHRDEADKLMAKIIDRIQRIDPAEAESARRQLNRFLDYYWIDHQGLERYWNDFEDALLISVEAAAERGNRARSDRQRPTPNSLRSVEASTSYVLLNGNNGRRAG